jgi:VWFA-related protein
VRKLVVALLLIAVPAFPQQQPPQPTFFSETIEVRVINVDVVVTGKDGRPVSGLTKEDFELFENGKPQAISNFLEMRPENSPVPPPPGSPQPAPADTPPPPDTRARNVVFFLDTTTIHPFTRDRIFKPLEKFLRRAMRAGDHVMIVSWNPGLKVDLEFTNDVAAATRTLDRLIATTTQALSTKFDREMTEQRIAGMPADYALRNEKPDINDAIREAELYAHKVMFQQSQRVEALKSVMSSLRGIGGRNAMVVFTDQLSINPAFPVFDFIERVKEQFNNGQMYVSRVAAQRYDDPTLPKQIADVANSSGITLYPISASGLGIDMSSISAENRGTFTAITSEMTHSDESLLAMHEIAAATGGKALTNSNNFDLAFDTLTQDMISYYSLGYHTEGQRQDAVRTISVKLRKKGYTLRARETFIEKSLKSEMQDAVAANLLYPIAKNDLNVSMAKAGDRTPASDQHVVVPVTITIPTESLTLIPDGTDLVGQFSSYTAFMRNDGRVSEVKQQQHQLRFPADSLKRRKSITVKYDLTIDDRTEGVSVGIMDDTSHVTGFATLPIKSS